MGVRRCRGKRRYRDRAEAGAALRRIRARSTRQRIPIRFYECPRCKGWHLTSQEPH